MAGELKFNQDILFNMPDGGQIKKHKLELLTSDPVGGDLFEGRLWYDTANDVVKYYDGAAVRTLGIAGAGITAIGGTGPVRANQTGNTVTISVAAAEAATPSVLALRTGTGALKAADGVDADDAVTKSQLDAVAATISQTTIGTWDASSNTYPAVSASGAGNPQIGERFVVTGAGRLGGAGVEVDDVLLVLQSAPGQTDANWHVIQGNTDQASETLLGGVRLASQARTNAGANDTDAVTPLKLATLLALGVSPVSATGTWSGTGAAQTVTATHNMGLKPKGILLEEDATGDQIHAGASYVDDNTHQIDGTFTSAATYRWTVFA